MVALLAFMAQTNVTSHFSAKICMTHFRSYAFDTDIALHMHIYSQEPFLFRTLVIYLHWCEKHDFLFKNILKSYQVVSKHIT